MATPKIPDYLIEADREWLPRRFQRLSWLQLKKIPIYARLRQTREPVTITGWRRAWFGISLTLYFNRHDRIEHGYDPSAVEIL